MEVGNDPARPALGDPFMQSPIARVRVSPRGLRDEAERLLSEKPLGAPQRLAAQLAALGGPLSERYQHVDVERLVQPNVGPGGRGLNAVLTALSVLEKYGRNLLKPDKPDYWQTVKFDNPVFKNTVDCIKGSRDVLTMFGYTERQADGLAFPDTRGEPDVDRVAAVTLDIYLARYEVDMILKGTHPKPELFSFISQEEIEKSKVEMQKQVAKMTPPTRLQPGHPPDTKTPAGVTRPAIPPKPAERAKDLAGNQRAEAEKHAVPAAPTGVTRPGIPPKPAERAKDLARNQRAEAENNAGAAVPTDECAICAEPPDVRCPTCDKSLCADCDTKMHTHPSREAHERVPLASPVSMCDICGGDAVMSCVSCDKRLCTDCDGSFHRHPRRFEHERVNLKTGRITKQVTSPETEERPPFFKPIVLRPLSVPAGSEWGCPRCSGRNLSSVYICRHCQTPHPPLDMRSRSSDAEMAFEAGDGAAAPPRPPATWECSTCTLVNRASAVLCGACNRPRQANKLKPTVPEDVPPARPPTPPAAPPGMWHCEACTMFNEAKAKVCVACDRSKGARAPRAAVDRQPGADVERQRPPEPRGPQHGDAPMLMAQEQRRKILQEEEKSKGIELIRLIRSGECQGFSANEVYCSLQASSRPKALEWLSGGGLDECLETIVAMAENLPHAGYGGSLSRQEAADAWIAADGNIEAAAEECLRARRVKIAEILRLGGYEVAAVAEKLKLNGGDVDKALVALQGELLRPSVDRCWHAPAEDAVLRDGDDQRKLRFLLARYELQSWGRATLALKLLAEENEQYQLEDVVRAVRDFNDLERARQYLKRECPICCNIYPMHGMVNIIFCECAVCVACFKMNFTFTIKEKNIANLTCPVCNASHQPDEESRTTFFSLLDEQFRNYLDPEVFRLFENKMRDRALYMMPNFRWCAHCPNGSIHDAPRLRMDCTYCNKSTCSKCKKPWEVQHEGLTCEAFHMWKLDNDPEMQAAGLAAFLKENGIACPKCKFRYALAKGGCMHFTCVQCKHEFCSGCYNPMCRGNECGMGCTNMGLHAHHPRDCLHYLRDWDIKRLQALLTDHNLAFNVKPRLGTVANTVPGVCEVLEQKDLANGLRDEACGKAVADRQAGLCELHYKEYLVNLVNENSVDPVHRYDLNELLAEMNRNGRAEPPHAANEDDAQYQQRLLQEILANIPLVKRD
ncbi:E3 ubiquitin-protein ligase RNF31 isoform X2 [Lampetra planeri]